MTHKFELVALGPPAFTARCACGDWVVTWSETDLVDVATLNDAIEAAVANWASHAFARVDLDARARGRDAAYYG